MSRFDDVPLVAGSVVGLRAFRVADRQGTQILMPPVMGNFTYRPGEQPWKAHCSDVRFHNQWCHGTIARLKACASPTHNHKVGGMGHGCGFYAWFKPARPEHDVLPDTVSAVVEGFGNTTVGDDGFRAEKMRLLGLIRPVECRGWVDPIADWLAVSYYTRVAPMIGLFLALAVTAVLLESGMPWLLAPLSWSLTGMALIAVVGITFELADHGGHRRDHPAPDCAQQRGCTDNPRPYDIEMLAQTYGVPLYDTLKDALKAHPLTVPEDLPTP